MKTKYVWHGLASPHDNFQNNRSMRTINLFAGRGNELKPASVLPSECELN